jgi:hypothetical protein
MEQVVAEDMALTLRTLNWRIGSLETNAQDVLNEVKLKAEEYMDISKYEGDDKKAKDDRALLRKQKDATKTTIKNIEAMWNKPLEDFVDTGRQIMKQFDLAIDTIDEWVKEGEAREEEAKRKTIQLFFDGRKIDLFTLDQIFNKKWLNKGFKFSDIKKEIEDKIAEVFTNIKVLEAITDHGLTAKALYLENLDMAAALRQVESLKANAEKLAREKVERDQRENQAQIGRNVAEQRQEAREERKEDEVQSLVAAALNLEEPKVEVTAPKLYTVTLSFTGTKEALEALKAWMSANRISYAKV